VYLGGVSPASLVVVFAVTAQACSSGTSAVLDAANDALPDASATVDTDSVAEQHDALGVEDSPIGLDSLDVSDLGAELGGFDTGSDVLFGSDAAVWETASSPEVHAILSACLPGITLLLQ